MKRIIFIRHLAYIWDNGNHMIRFNDFIAMAALGQNFSIDAIIHSPRICDCVTASALALGSGCQFLVKDERLSSGNLLQPRYFLQDMEVNSKANGCKTVAVIAGREPLELLGCPHLQHGEFFFRRENPADSPLLSRGGIDDFRNVRLPEIRPAAEIIYYLY